MAKQNEHALEASPTATAMIRLMEKRMTDGSMLSDCFGGVRYFKGSMTDLLMDLKKIAEDELGIDTKDKLRWPRSPQALGNKLNEAATNLRDIGIVIERPEDKASHTKSVILIKQEAAKSVYRSIIVRKSRLWIERKLRAALVHVTQDRI